MGGEYGTHGGEERCIQGFGGENLKEREHLEDLRLNGRIILKWEHGMDWSGTGWGQVAGCCECGKDPVGPLSCGEFLG